MNSFNTLGIYWILLMIVVFAPALPSSIEAAETDEAFCILGRSPRVRGEVFEKARQSLERVWRLQCAVYDRVLDEPSQPAFKHQLSEKTKIVFWLDEDKNQELILRGFDAESSLYWDTIRYGSASQTLEDSDGGFRLLRDSFPFLGYFSDGVLISWAAESRRVTIAKRGKVLRQRGWPKWLGKPEKIDSRPGFQIQISENGAQLSGSGEMLSRLQTQKDLWLWTVEAR